MYSFNPTDFVSGATAMAYLIAGLFFLRFWRRTRDSLFLIFAIAFWLLAASSTAVALAGQEYNEAWVYLFRLAAFVLIIIAILRKNLQVRGRR
ncbi:MAG TPA: DUF5985 family protein [Stellaceae bacterium]|nr:DUF5985 family protein [Stellaceae bacterium]